VAELRKGGRIGGRYTLEQRLGAGGMGEVWLAELHGAGAFRRRVVLKVLAPERRGDARLAGMLADEARIVAMLHYPGIVPAIDYLETEEHGPIFVLEFVDGASLRHILMATQRNGMSLPEELAAYVGAQIARALHAAHTAPLSIVHRDVAPDNVLVSRLGAVYLGDFGVARAEGNSDVTEPGSGPKGKRAYMAPEQALGLAVGPPADVYSLGKVIAECTQPGPLLAEVLRKATAEKIEDRFATAAELSLAFHQAVPQPPDPGAALERWLRENAQEALIGRKTSHGGRTTPPPAGRARQAPQLFAGVAPPRRRALKIAAALVALVIVALPVALMARAHGGIGWLKAAIAGVPDARHGELRVTSRPISAEVYVDGTLRGTTPLRIELTVGKHDVRIGAPLMQRWRAAELQVKEGVQHQLDVDLSE
jgi:Protein kinase domain/PEGA domain